MAIACPPAASPELTINQDGLARRFRRNLANQIHLTCSPVGVGRGLGPSGCARHLATKPFTEAKPSTITFPVAPCIPPCMWKSSSSRGLHSARSGALAYQVGHRTCQHHRPSCISACRSQLVPHILGLHTIPGSIGVTSRACAESLAVDNCIVGSDFSQKRSAEKICTKVRFGSN